MTRFVPHGGQVDILLETVDGQPIKIRGTTHDSSFIATGDPMFGNWVQDGIEQLTELSFHQGGALYDWDGEQAYGMIERSYPKVEFG